MKKIKHKFIERKSGLEDTKALLESGLTKDEIKAVAKLNKIMNNKMKLLDDKIKNKPKKHKCEEDLFSKNKCHICGKQMFF